MQSFTQSRFGSWCRKTPWLLATILSVLLVSAVAFSQTASPTLDTAATGQTPPKVLDGSANLVQHYDPSQMLRLAFALKPPHPQEEQQFIDELHDKKSPLFHQFLSAEEWNARFSPSAEDEQAVASWATSQGLTITQRYPNRLLVDVQAPAGVIEKALNIKLNNYRVGANVFFSNDRDPVIPSSLTNVIESVQGLNSFESVRPVNRGMKQVARPDYVPGPPVARGSAQHENGSSENLSATLSRRAAQTAGAPQITNDFYDPSDIYSNEAYNYRGLYNQGHCCNPLGNSTGSPAQTSIAIAAFGDLNYSDVASFHSQYPYLAYNIQKVYVDGTYTCNNLPGNPDDNCLEVTLDTEWSMAMSNSFGSYLDTSKVWVYEGVNYNDATVIDLYNRILTDNNARIFSTSWACAEGQSYSASGDCYNSTMKARDNILASMVGQGWTLLAASGDEGATATWCEDKIGVFFPASDPNVIAAGGTTLELASGPVYFSETGWTGGTWAGACDSNDGGSTGGFSSYWGVPSYQSGMGFGSRSVPDISLNASIGQNMYFAPAGGLIGVGGTSIVAPELAGFFAQENAYLLSIGNVCGSSGTSACAPMGNANYYLYDEGIYQTAAHYPYYDITSGCNSNDVTAEYGLTPYCAKAGFDQVTGWGSSNMLQLAWAINWFHAAAYGSPSVSFTGPTTGKWYNTDQIVSWNVIDNSGSGGYPPTGIAGFTQGWDSIPSDPSREATPGTGNSFYDGPQYPNAKSGCLDLSGASCAGSVSQGCHTAHVQAWNNMGKTSGDVTYGPICYDTIAPVTVASLSGTLSGSVYTSAVRVTLSATDSGSGVKATYARVDSGLWAVYSGPITLSATGGHTVQFYSTDQAGNTAAVQSAGFSIESPTAVTIASSLNPLTYGSSATFTAVVTATFGSVPTGTVTFKDGATTLGTSALVSGKATLSTAAFSGGSNSITAIYNGDAFDRPGTSAALIETVKQAGSTTTTVSSLNPSAYDQSVTFTATVKSATTGVPAGIVTFKNGAVALGTATLNVSGVAIFSTSALSVGAHSVTAVYGGSVDFLASTSAALSQTVKQTSSTTTVVSSLNPSAYDQSVTFTATVKSATTGVPAGTLIFKNGAIALGTATLNASGVATLSTSTLAIGPHSITAVYNGSVDFLTSTSAALAQTVKAAASTTTVASSLNPSSFDQSVTFAATVKSATTGVPAGTVTFKNGATAMGTATLNSGGVATFSISALAVGVHTITAVYSGSADFLTSTSAALAQTVKEAASTTTVVPSLNPSSYGQSVTFTATVKSATTGVPAGTVTFRNGGVALGTATLNASGVAIFSTSALSVGAHSITAVYSGSANFLTSTSAALAQTVKEAASTTAVVSSLNPSLFSQSVTFTATVKSATTGVPAGTVTFKNGATVLGTGTLNASGVATFSTSTLAVGAHSITAVYAGSADFLTSTSAALMQTINP
jgi:hypothetical protein